jgi:hypothetical protein
MTAERQVRIFIMYFMMAIRSKTVETLSIKIRTKISPS